MVESYWKEVSSLCSSKDEFNHYHFVHVNFAHFHRSASKLGDVTIKTEIEALDHSEISTEHSSWLERLPAEAGNLTPPNDAAVDSEKERNTAGDGCDVSWSYAKSLECAVSGDIASVSVDSGEGRGTGVLPEELG